MQIPDSTAQEAERRASDPVLQAQKEQRKADTLSGLKAAYEQEVEARQLQAETQPVSYDGNTFPADRESQGRIGSLIQRGETVKAETGSFSYKARTTGGTLVDLSLAQLKDLAGVYAEQVAAARSRAETLFSEIDAAASEADLNALDLESGWP